MLENVLKKPALQPIVHLCTLAKGPPHSSHAKKRKRLFLQDGTHTQWHIILSNHVCCTFHVVESGSADQKARISHMMDILCVYNYDDDLYFISIKILLLVCPRFTIIHFA